jgi:hypothetical protein
MTTPATRNTNSPGSLAVLKIQLDRGGVSEHHRKRVHADSFTFAQLHALLQSLVAGPENARLTITYLDSDCDEIQVKDDADLREAFLTKDEKNSDTLRLSVKLEPGTGTGSRKCTPDTAGSSLPRRCHNWCSDRTPQRKAQRCQRRPATGGAASIFSLLFGNDDALPFPPLQALDLLAAERLKCESSPDFFQDLLAQPRLVAFLRTAADALDTNNKAGGAEGSDPCELARKLWLDKDCRYLVQWLKERAPEMSPILAIFDGAMKSPRAPTRATQAAETEANDSGLPLIWEAVGDFDDVSRHLVDFDSLFATSPFCAAWRSCRPRPHTASARASEQNPEPKEDVHLQAAIERSLSNTPSQEEEGTPDHRPKVKDENENGEAAAVEGSIEQRPHSPLPVELFATHAGAAPAVEGSIAQRAPAPRPVETSATDANAENTNENRNPAPHTKGLYETEIEQLRSMGFNDDEAIRTALNATEGNVEYALWRLL